MSDLVLHTQPKAIQKIEDLMNDEPLGRSLQTFEGKNRLLDLISTTTVTQYTVNGVPDKLQDDEDAAALHQSTIYNEIKRRGFLTFKEIKYIFGRGLVGEYGQNTHFFNAKNVKFWIDSYVEKERTKTAKLKAQAIQEAAEIRPELTPREKAELSRQVWTRFVEWVKKQHGRYKEFAGRMEFTADDIENHPAPELYYRKMIERGMILEPPVEVKKELMIFYTPDALEELKQKGYRSIASKMINIGDPSVKAVAKRMAMMKIIKDQLFTWFSNDQDLDKVL